MSANIVTQSNQMKWEVVGGGRRTKKSDPSALVNGNANNSPTSKHFKLLKQQMPKIEPMQPIRVNPTIYDALRDSSDDDDSDDMARKVAAAAQKKQQAAKKSPPKQRAAQQQQQAPVPIKNDLDSVLATINIDDMQQEYRNFDSLYPKLPSLAFRHIASFFNMKLNSVPEADPTFSADDLNVPYTKLDRKLKDYFTGLVDVLSKNELEGCFDYIMKEIIEESKAVSHHGYRIVTQILTRKYPSLALKYLSKYNDIIKANRHRQLRCSIALSALGQGGFLSLPVGLKIWFDVMLPLLSFKSFTNDIIAYLYNLLQHHKKSLTKDIQHELINIKQYFEIYDLVNDKTIHMTKDTNTKLNSSFAIIKDVFLNHQTKSQFSNYFDTILTRLPLNSADPRQQDILQLAKIALLHGKDTYSKFREIYSKYLQQSIILVKYITVNWNEFKSVNFNELKQTMVYFEKNSDLYLQNTQQLQQSASTNNKTSKQQQQANTKQPIQEFNRLTKELIGKRVTPKYSIMGRLFKFLFYTILFASIFFYWDQKSNKSVYTNQAKQQLEKYGLLEVTLNSLDYINQQAVKAKKFVIVNGPPLYQKCRKNVVYYSTIAWQQTKDYSTIAWKFTEPYIQKASSYANDGKIYVQKNLPTLVDNLTSVFFLIVNYLQTIFSFVVEYLELSLRFVEKKMFGLKSGELNVVFKNGLDQLWNYTSDFFKWLNETTA